MNVEEEGCQRQCSNRSFGLHRVDYVKLPLRSIHTNVLNKTERYGCLSGCQAKRSQFLAVNETSSFSSLLPFVLIVDMDCLCSFVPHDWTHTGEANVEYCSNRSFVDFKSSVKFYFFPFIRKQYWYISCGHVLHIFHSGINVNHCILNRYCVTKTHSVCIVPSLSHHNLCSSFPSTLLSLSDTLRSCFLHDCRTWCWSTKIQQISHTVFSSKKKEGRNTKSRIVPRARPCNNVFIQIHVYMFTCYTIINNNTISWSREPLNVGWKDKKIKTTIFTKVYSKF